MGLLGSYARRHCGISERSALPWEQKRRPSDLILDAVESLEVVPLNDALELLAAVGAAEILGIDGGIEVDDVAASGADDLEVLVLVLFLAEEVVIVLVKAAVEVAAGAVAVALEIVILVLIIEVKENLLNVAQILVQLLAVVLELADLSLHIVHLGGHLGDHIQQGGDQLALLGGLIGLQAVAQTLQIHCLFHHRHDKVSFTANGICVASATAVTRPRQPSGCGSR